MFKKILSLLVVVLVLNLANAQVAFAGTKEEKFAEKVKTGITKLGTGPEAKIKVKLKDKTKIEGYITESNENQFVVVNSKTGEAVSVAYSSVKQVKGSNLSKNVVFAIALAAIVGFIVIVIAVVNSQGGG